LTTVSAVTGVTVFLPDLATIVEQDSHSPLSSRSKVDMQGRASIKNQHAAIEPNGHR
jgi:hypothetical protein